MTEKEAIDLLFRPSFSTSEKITDVSGRGVGLDVVKSKIEALGGDVEVKTKYGEGRTFSIRLPLTLAIIQALMVKLGDEKQAITLGGIETIEDVPVTDIKYIHAKEVINLRGSVIPLIRLRDILDVPGEQEESDTITVVIVRKGDKLAGLVVDSLIGQMEIVIKSLGKYININRMISGATILGDGSVALIIDANTLVQEVALVMENVNAIEEKKEEVSTTVQYIVVKIGNEQYGINIKYIDNIVRKQDITRVPKTQHYYKGVINLRGEIIPVMSVRLKLGLEDDVYTDKTRYIIVKVEGATIGIIVDEVREVVTLNSDD